MAGWTVVPNPDTSAWKPVAQAAPIVAGLPAGQSLPGYPAAPVPNMQPSSIGSAAPALLTAGDVLKGVAKSVPGTVASTYRGLGKVVGGVPSDTMLKMEQAGVPTNTAQTIGKGIGNAAQFLIPGVGEDAAMARLGPMVGKAAPLLKAGLAAVGSGTVNAAQGGSFGTGAIAGGVGSGIGQGMKAIAPTLAESALKVTGNDRMYGRTVGQAILDDTKGIKPSVIEESARAKIAELKPMVEQSAADAGAAGSRGSLAPARTGVMQRIGQHTQNRAMGSAGELTPLRDFLQTDAATGMPLAQSQAPTGLLQLKRGLDSDFIGSWNPTRNTNNELDAAKSAYGALADEFHAAAPGTAAADKRISSLIPVANRANRTSLGAGMVQGTLDRFRTPTGALTGMFGGGAAGYHEGGLPGALTGAAVGAALPAFIGSPEAQMFMARGANGFMPRLAVPLAIGAGMQLRRGLNAEPEQ